MTPPDDTIRESGPGPGPGAGAGPDGPGPGRADPDRCQEGAWPVSKRLTRSPATVKSQRVRIVPHASFV